jgi:hypothetical protein
MRVLGLELGTLRALRRPEAEPAGGCPVRRFCGGLY